MKEIYDVSYIGNEVFGGVLCEVYQICLEGGEVDFDFIPIYEDEIGNNPFMDRI